MYLRLPPGKSLDDVCLHFLENYFSKVTTVCLHFFLSFFCHSQVPMTVIEDMAQLVKYNSISGNKMNDIDVVYTMWSNLKKTDGMEAGQVIIHYGPNHLLH